MQPSENTSLAKWWWKTSVATMAIVVTCFVVALAAWAMHHINDEIADAYPWGILLSFVGGPFLMTAIYHQYCKYQHRIDVEFDMAEDA